MDDSNARLASELADGTTALDPETEQRLREDLRFQAELAQYRKLLRMLHTLRDQVFDPGETLLDEVLTALDEAPDRHGVRQVITAKRAMLGGLAAATAAGVGSAFVLARRRRLAAA